MLVILFSSLFVLASAATDDNITTIEIDDIIGNEPFLTSTIKGHLYTLNVNLIGYDESEITVQSKRYLVAITFTYLDAYAFKRLAKMYVELPETVSGQGTWTYNNDQLAVMFPLNETVSSGKDNLTADAAVDVSATDGNKVGNFNEDPKDPRLRQEFSEWERHHEQQLFMGDT